VDILEILVSTSVHKYSVHVPCNQFSSINPTIIFLTDKNRGHIPYDKHPTPRPDQSTSRYPINLASLTHIERHNMSGTGAYLFCCGGVNGVCTLIFEEKLDWHNAAAMWSPSYFVVNPIWAAAPARQMLSLSPIRLILLVAKFGIGRWDGNPAMLGKLEQGE